MKLKIGTLTTNVGTNITTMMISKVYEGWGEWWRHRKGDGTPLLVPHFGVPYIKILKVGYHANVLHYWHYRMVPHFLGYQISILEAPQTHTHQHNVKLNKLIMVLVYTITRLPWQRSNSEWNVLSRMFHNPIGIIAQSFLLHFDWLIVLPNLVFIF